MRKHFQYLRYLLKHKWFVYKGGRLLKLPFWQLITHDWSKFLPSEWLPYAAYFYGTKDQDSFDLAWRHHQRRQPHHWQYWLLTFDAGNTKALAMPEKYIKEMVADWYGAGYAINGKNDVYNWYMKTKDTKILHETTRWYVEYLVNSMKEI